jgi:hypothetical protein
MIVEYTMLLEALKIVKKGSEVSDLTGTKSVGKFQNKDVVRTVHSSEVRKDKERDYGLDNTDYINILKKSCTEKLKSGEIYNIMYKNSKGKYDMIVLGVNDTTITIITVLQQDRLSPNYNIKPGDIKILSEKLNIIYLEVL